MAMVPEIKTKWLTALRSGEFEQCRGTLEQAGKNCCLGVLANILETPKVPEGPDYNGPVDFIFDGGSFRYHTELPDSALEQIGMKPLEQVDLINMNDGQGDYEPQTFLQIADWIEENL